MNSKVPLTVVILTFNEELNINQSISNVIDWAKSVFVLDSYSTDKTIEIAEQLGAKTFYRKFDNYSIQRNYAIRELPIDTEWMLFLDADEYLTEGLKHEIDTLFSQINLIEFDGFYLRRRLYFMDKWIKYGGYYPTLLMRLFKRNRAICERDINEHITVKGKTSILKNDFIDHNRKDFTDWITKHNKYSSFESTQFDTANQATANFWGSQSEKKQWIRQRIWNKLLPPLLRPFIYFFYRYFFKLGFLDGKIGFIYHFMQGLVFQFMIDVKYLENKFKR